jgi:hypothetical protein
MMVFALLGMYRVQPTWKWSDTPIETWIALVLVPMTIGLDVFLAVVKSATISSVWRVKTKRPVDYTITSLWGFYVFYQFGPAVFGIAMVSWLWGHLNGDW